MVGRLTNTITAYCIADQLHKQLYIFTTYLFATKRHATVKKNTLVLLSF